MRISAPKWFSQPLDRAAIALIVVLSLLIALLLLSGDRTTPQVRDFSWQHKQVGAADQAFILTFNRPMVQSSVERNLQIQPPLPGKISWAGRRLAYTLSDPVPYGTAFQLQLRDAEAENSTSRLVKPFTGRFRSRDRAFVYLGTSGPEAGRLVLVNLSRNRKRILTPKDLTVAQFKAYPERDRILFSATRRQKQPSPGLDLQLYTVSTGIHVKSPTETPRASQPVGHLEKILDDPDYELLGFDLAPDGQRIVVQRGDRRNLEQPAALWVLESDGSPQLLEGQTGGSFLIAPDSQSLVLAQGQGLSVLPLEPDRAGQPLDFLPQYGTVLSFSQDGAAAALIKYNPDYTRSLFWVTNQGVQKELLRTTGSILEAVFDPRQQRLYCLLTRLLPSTAETEYNEEPYLAAIALDSGQLTPLLKLPGQRDPQISLAPDGSALLLDQTQTTDQPTANPLLTNQGEPILTSRLWLLPLPASKEKSELEFKTLRPQALSFAGYRPLWLP